MPSPAEIQVITSSAQSQYGIDLTSVTNDRLALQSFVSKTSTPPPAGPVSTLAQAFITTSSAIYGDSATFTFDTTSALVPDLETISFASVVPDPRLDARRIEQNVDEASRYSQVCLQVRQTYADIAKLRNDTRFKTE